MTYFQMMSRLEAFGQIFVELQDEREFREFLNRNYVRFRVMHNDERAKFVLA